MSIFETIRPNDKEVTLRINKISIPEAKAVIKERLNGSLAFPLPRIAVKRGVPLEEPGDIIVDIINEYPDSTKNLVIACSDLTRDLSINSDQSLDSNKNYAARLLAVCGFAAVVPAIPNVAKLAQRESLHSIILSNGESLQNRSLRVLAGLIGESFEDRNVYKVLFEKALHTDGLSEIGLTTLYTFWPKDRKRVIQVATEFANPRINNILNLIDEGIYDS